MSFKSIFSLLVLLLTSCSQQPSAFRFTENDQGVELSENGEQVLFYQKAVKSLNGTFPRNNYIHPLYSLSGDTLTEDFPDDHLHHRGIFWAWHQLYAGDQNLGDGWELESFFIDIVELLTEPAPEQATIEIRANWYSAEYQNEKPYVEENTAIIVYPRTPNKRIIDFKISLRALVPDIRIGGSNDAKGYGGFSTRIKMPEGLVFTSEKGQVKPQTLQLSAGPWMDFSAPYEKNGEISGMTILCHPSLPNFPQPWILRQRRSMQNPAFPGRQPVELPMDKPTILRYRVILHKDPANIAEINNWQAEYAATDF